MVTLRLVPVSGNPIEVTRDKSLVGRDPGCDIVVTDGSVSRKHAQLEQRAGIWHVVDLGSANGTYVNSLKIADTVLKSGQELRFGALAFRVDLIEDPEATVARPVLQGDTDTVMAPSLPPEMPPGAPPAPPPPAAPPPPPVPRAASAPPPPPPSAAGARDRFRPAGASPVPPMSGGARPPRKGKGPLFWIVVGCCGCLLLALLFAGVLGGGVWVMTRGAAEAAHSHLEQVRQGDIDAAYGSLSSSYQAEMSREDFARMVEEHPGLQDNRDATFFSRSVDNDRAFLQGVLVSASGLSEPVRFELVKEGGTWKIAAIRFEGGLGTDEE